MSTPEKDKFPTKLSAGIEFWAAVFATLSPIMAECQEMALAYTPDLLDRGTVDPIEFFVTMLERLQSLGDERKVPIYHQKATELRERLRLATHRIARTPSASISDRFAPSISKAYDAKELDDWATVVAVAEFLAT